MGGFLEELLMYFSSVCISVWVCAVYLQPAVPVWWSDLGSIMSPAGALFRVVMLAPTALWVIRNHLQEAYPKHTVAAKGVAWSKWSFCCCYWFPHLRASLLLLITDQGTASRTRLWLLEHSWSSWFRLPAWRARSCAVCLDRHHCGWDFTTLNLWQKTASTVCKNLKIWAGFQLQCRWYKAFTNYFHNFIFYWKW